MAPLPAAPASRWICAVWAPCGAALASGSRRSTAARRRWPGPARAAGGEDQAPRYAPRRRCGFIAGDLPGTVAQLIGRGHAVGLLGVLRGGGVLGQVGPYPGEELGHPEDHLHAGARS